MGYGYDFIRDLGRARLDGDWQPIRHVVTVTRFSPLRVYVYGRMSSVVVSSCRVWCASSAGRGGQTRRRREGKTRVEMWDSVSSLFAPAGDGGSYEACCTASLSLPAASSPASCSPHCIYHVHSSSSSTSERRALYSTHTRYIISVDRPNLVLLSMGIHRYLFHTTQLNASSSNSIKWAEFNQLQYFDYWKVKGCK